MNEKIYLYRNYVDFRKQINGLTLSAQDVMKLNIFKGEFFVFCCKKKDKFKWSVKHESKIICWDKQRFDRLLKGVDVSQLSLHKSLNYSDNLLNKYYIFSCFHGMIITVRSRKPKALA